MNNKELIYLLATITAAVYVPVIWVSYKQHRSFYIFILLLTINLGTIYHIYQTFQQVSRSADPQAGMGTAVYLLASLGIFAIAVLAAILVFFLRR